jgi:DNA-binding XRE family transcriptional regulator
MLEIISNVNSEINTFPVLRGLMAKHKNLSQEQMGQVIGTTYGTFGKKLNGHIDFTFTEMWKIRDFFNAKGESLTIENIFFDWIVHNSEQK